LPHELAFDFSLKGVTEVSVTGDYLGFSLKKFSAFIKDIIRDRIKEELSFLLPKEGKDGFAGRLVIEGEEGRSRVSLRLNIDLPINLLPIVQVDASRVDVLPNAEANLEFRRWLEGSFDALALDARRQTCAL
jgi:hypothetical protein